MHVWQKVCDLCRDIFCSRSVKGNLGVDRRVLREECSSFSKSDSDIEWIVQPQMSISLNDSEPIKRAYMPIPKPLLQELKTYLQDLKAQGWIKFLIFLSGGLCPKKGWCYAPVCRLQGPQFKNTC